MNAIEYLGKQSKPLLTAVGFVVVFLLGVIDYLTGPEISFSIFYLLPISLVTWFVGKREGVSISLASASTWLLADLIWAVPHSHPAIPFWNAIVRLAFFLIMVFLLSKLKAMNEHLEDKVEESEIRYRSLVDLSPDAIFVQSNGNFIFVNNSLVKLLGGINPHDLLGKHVLGFIHPDYHGIVRERIRQLREEGKTVPFIEEKWLRLDGSAVDVEVAATPLKFQNQPAAQVVVRDISERKLAKRASKQAEKELRQSEEKYRRFFEEDLTGNFIAQPDGTLLACNPAFARTFGFASVEEAMSVNLNELYPRPEEYNTLLALLPEEKKVENYEAELRHRDGRTIYVVENVNGRFNDAGELVEIQGYLFDDTKRRQLEQQLIQAQKMESLGTLAGGIAHDFNNLLGIILGHASMLARIQSDPAKLASSIEAIIKTAERGASLVKQLLTFARKTDVLPESVRVNDSVNEITKLFREIFPKTITISTHLEENLPSIIADTNQIHQVLLNLGLNARDAMPRGGTLSIKTGLVKVDTIRQKFPKATTKEYVFISVADTGIGMDEATQNRIFEPFFTTKQRDKGTGLGLATVYGIVENHRGLMNVESKLKQGTIFNLYFPVQPGGIESFEIKKELIGDVAGGTETILLVEDEEMLRELLRVVLMGKGYTVLTASDGKEAVDIYARHHKDIALVLCDMGLPKLGGDEVFVKLKEINSGVKVIFASGYLDQNLESEMLRAGAKDFVLKPYIPKEILEKIRATIDRTSLEYVYTY